ncbi:MAG: TonB-dependent receptor [Elusimicrobiales bacterium]
MRRNCLLLSLALLALTAGRAAAETEVWAGEVVGLAARGAKPVDKTPGSVSVVVKQDLAAKTVQTADQALNALPGVFNRRGKGIMDTSSAVTLRGVPEQKRTLVLYDGMPLNDAYTGAVSFGGMQIEEIDRVEVARGSFSGLYGGNAMGGVVNFVPRRPEKREFSLKAGYGGPLGPEPAMANMVSGYLAYGDKLGKKLRLLAGYGYKHTDGYASDLNVQSAAPTAGLTGWSATTTNTGAARYLIGDKGDNGWKETNASLRAWYDLSDRDKLSVSFSSLEYGYFYGDPRTYLRNAAGAEVWTYGSVKEGTFLGGDGGRQQNSYSAAYDRKGDRSELKVSLGYIDTLKSWYVTPASASALRSGGAGKVSNTPASAINSEAQLTLPEVSPRHSLIGGVSWRYSEAETSENNLADWKDEAAKGSLTYKAGGKNADIGAYLQDEIRLHDKLAAYLSLRGDWWRTYDGAAEQPGTAGYPVSYSARTDSALSPKASLVYNPSGAATLRASAGRSFRPPTVYELYRTWTSGAKVYQGNPGLAPETVDSWDAGAEYRPWKGLQLGAVYFENRMKDLVYRRTVTANLLVYENAGEAFGKGWEFEAEQVFARGRVFANLTLNDAEITRNSASAASVGKKLQDLPEKLYSFGGDLKAGRFTFGALGRYIGKRWTSDANTDTVDGVYGSRDPYFTAEAKAAWSPLDDLSVSLAAQNLFNKVYYDYYRAPGRTWFAEVSWKI